MVLTVIYDSNDFSRRTHKHCSIVVPPQEVIDVSNDAPSPTPSRCLDAGYLSLKSLLVNWWCCGSREVSLCAIIPGNVTDGSSTECASATISFPFKPVHLFVVSSNTSNSSDRVDSSVLYVIGVDRSGTFTAVSLTISVCVMPGKTGVALKIVHRGTAQKKILSSCDSEVIDFALLRSGDTLDIVVTDGKMVWHEPICSELSNFALQEKKANCYIIRPSLKELAKVCALCSPEENVIVLGREDGTLECIDVGNQSVERWNVSACANEQCLRFFSASDGTFYIVYIKDKFDNLLIERRSLADGSTLSSAILCPPKKAVKLCLLSPCFPPHGAVTTKDTVTILWRSEEIKNISLNFFDFMCVSHLPRIVQESFIVSYDIKDGRVLRSDNIFGGDSNIFISYIIDGYEKPLLCTSMQGSERIVVFAQNQRLGTIPEVLKLFQRTLLSPSAAEYDFLNTSTCPVASQATLEVWTNVIPAFSNFSADLEEKNSDGLCFETGFSLLSSSADVSIAARLYDLFTSSISAPTQVVSLCATAESVLSVKHSVQTQQDVSYGKIVRDIESLFDRLLCFKRETLAKPIDLSFQNRRTEYGFLVTQFLTRLFVLLISLIGCSKLLKDSRLPQEVTLKARSVATALVAGYVFSVNLRPEATVFSAHLESEGSADFSEESALCIVSMLLVSRTKIPVLFFLNVLRRQHPLLNHFSLSLTQSPVLNLAALRRVLARLGELFKSSGDDTEWPARLFCYLFPAPDNDGLRDVMNVLVPERAVCIYVVLAVRSLVSVNHCALPLDYLWKRFLLVSALEALRDISASGPAVALSRLAAETACDVAIHLLRRELGAGELRRVFKVLKDTDPFMGYATKDTRAELVSQIEAFIVLALSTGDIDVLSDLKLTQESLHTLVEESLIRMSRPSVRRGLWLRDLSAGQVTSESREARDKRRFLAGLALCKLHSAAGNSEAAVRAAYDVANSLRVTQRATALTMEYVRALLALALACSRIGCEDGHIPASLLRTVQRRLKQTEFEIKVGHFTDRFPWSPISNVDAVHVLALADALMKRHSYADAVVLCETFRYDMSSILESWTLDLSKTALQGRGGDELRATPPTRRAQQLFSSYSVCLRHDHTICGCHATDEDDYLQLVSLESLHEWRALCCALIHFSIRDNNYAPLRRAIGAVLQTLHVVPPFIAHILKEIDTSGLFVLYIDSLGDMDGSFNLGGSAQADSEDTKRARSESSNSRAKDKQMQNSPLMVGSILEDMFSIAHCYIGYFNCPKGKLVDASLPLNCFISHTVLDSVLTIAEKYSKIGGEWAKLANELLCSAGVQGGDLICSE